MQEFIEKNRYKLEYSIKKQQIIFDLYDQLYQKFIEVKKENEELRNENNRLKGVRSQTAEGGYVSTPQYELKPIDEAETESNEVGFKNNISSVSSRMKNYNNSIES